MITEAVESRPTFREQIKKNIPAWLLDFYKEIRYGHEVNYPYNAAVNASGITASFEINHKTGRFRLEKFGGERKLLSKVLGTLENDDVFLDVGASLGLYVVFAGKKVGNNGLSIAIEPDSSNLKELNQNIGLNNLDNAIVLPIAAGEKEGKIGLFTANNADSTSPSVGVSVQGHLNSSEVDMFTIDSLVNEKKIPRTPKTILIDVEGAEYRVLQGMHGLLSLPTDQKPKHIFIEIHPDFLEKFGQKTEDINDFLKEHGYKSAGKPKRRGAQFHAHFIPI